MRYIDQAPQFVQLHQPRPGASHPELVAGLMQTPAGISPKFFYDALGSRLFDAITELPEYYPTRTEAAVFAQHGAGMARHVPEGAVLLDLGAGSCAKAARLFPVLRPSAYVPVDISVDYLRDTLAALQQRHPDLPMLGLGMDFSTLFALGADANAWLAGRALSQQPRVVFYPGSSIGNFLPDQALALLCQAHAVCEAGGAGGGLLIGVDRVKPRDVLERAYDDELGVTAAFNRNLLRHVNRLLNADFAPAAWQHVALFNADESRIEMHLQAMGTQTVRWPGGERTFADGERLHTENSYKWQPQDFAMLLREAGFGAPKHWTDANGWFSVFWAPV
ncbi:L-histidine N(alpha)-methyltransferase [Hydrogenophaga laconesensis]|uniref:Dimethylhistidine N-methyltransferase n=1 Tax=Hydrogenophaga laconesensis TaxID=1805971 RepID=A0ABU1VCC0_9BURK|nr:L-histidine N(alpha)-methyltransferase [Hydrogenophaga laconesensis]MDR7095121.1 dimethylhistidine N-methyltransferase [Hydrogenophaga laconesensis]